MVGVRMVVEQIHTVQKDLQPEAVVVLVVLVVLTNHEGGYGGKGMQLPAHLETLQI